MDKYIWLQKVKWTNMPKTFSMHRFGSPQERIGKRLGEGRAKNCAHLGIMATLPKSPNSDLGKSFSVPQLVEKHC